MAPVNYAASANPTSVIIRDFSGDGKLDLAVADLGGNNGNRVRLTKRLTSPGTEYQTDATGARQLEKNSVGTLVHLLTRPLDFGLYLAVCRKLAF